MRKARLTIIIASFCSNPCSDDFLQFHSSIDFGTIFFYNFIGQLALGCFPWYPVHVDVQGEEQDNVMTLCVYVQHGLLWSYKQQSWGFAVIQFFSKQQSMLAES